MDVDAGQMCSIMTQASRDTKQATIYGSRKTHQPTFEIHIIWNHIYIYVIYSYTFNFYPVIWNLLCIFCCFPWWFIFFWKEHHVYISLRKVSGFVRTPRLDIDEFQAALRKVRVFVQTSRRHGVFGGYFVPWQWEVVVNFVVASPKPWKHGGVKPYNMGY